MTRVGVPRLRRGAAGVALLCLTTTILGAGYLGASAAPAVAAGPVVAAAVADPAYEVTKTLTRVMRQPDGTDKEVDSREVTVVADRTTDLQGRQSVAVSWTGARPTASVQGDLSSSSGQQQEYPVIILQCRGVDNQVTPETCWTTDTSKRDTSDSAFYAVWTHDLYASDLDRSVSSPAADAWPTECDSAGDATTARHLVPFLGADGTKYWSCNGGHSSPPEMGVGSALPPNELGAITGLDGTGGMPFEVRTSAENQSLGCSATVPCSIVVIPIMGISCRDADRQCVKEAKGEPGVDYSDQVGTNVAVTGATWWSASNWRNRFVIPLTIAAARNVCDLLDARAPLAFYGSELISQAALQWAPAYCGKSDRFKFQANAMPEATAFRNLRRGIATAALVSYPGEPQEGDLPYAYAPIAVTGFAIAYVVDIPGNAGQLTELRLTPKLLAKLMSGSYPGVPLSDASKKERPDLANNPWSINVDPEFLDLNPGLRSELAYTKNADITWASLLSLANPSDAIRSLTEYIAADPEAMAFLNGEKDPSGMTVNAAYQGLALPRDDWPLLDVWRQPSLNVCDADQPLAWFNRVLAPVSGMNKIAQDVLSATPESLYSHDQDPVSALCKFTRSPRQNYGARHMLGLVSVADARRYGLTTALLRTSGTGTSGTFVGPENVSMAAAIETATQSALGGPYLLDQAVLRTHPDAYPGTMTVNVAAALTGLNAGTAGQVSQFIDVATTEGQLQGTAIGQLPEGYLPITSTGATAALYTSARKVADAIAAQTGLMVEPVVPPVITASPAAPPVAQPAAPPATAVSNPFVAVPPAAASTAVVPLTSAGDPAPVGPSVSVAAASVRTDAPRLGGLGGATLPAIFGVGTLGLIGAPVLRQISTRRPRS
ncbi:hypothetical protein [Pengzhenrongella frigida]|uniref:PBP domain-containing protein n=1 Tax=Pengzhenrongella frigida TaxID=1259133 RepID=A0A4Q5MWN1_9MICO|nr:hypothetical protein [Cellulomonas sp. HLT2-17]RYV49989.1 hypothetical protein EUA98_15975 [Cellulomonas sp. HLT2-17]